MNNCGILRNIYYLFLKMFQIITINFEVFLQFSMLWLLQIP